MQGNDLVNKRREQFDIVEIMLERSNAYPLNKNKDEIIENYSKLPFIYKRGLNRLILMTFFRTLNINDLSIYEVISKQSCMETIIRAIECQIKFIEENDIDIEEIKNQEEFIDVCKVPKDASVQYRTCWNCSGLTLDKFLKDSDSVIVCSVCGKSYYKGKELLSLNGENKGNTRRRIPELNDKKSGGMID